MPFTKRLLAREGWQHIQADHCSNRYDWEQEYPRKRSSWFLFNLDPAIPLQLCNSDCGPCLVEGTKFHKWLISYRNDMVPGQTVVEDNPVEKARIPAKIFDLMDQHRLHFSKSTAGDPTIPDSFLSEILLDTGRASGYISGRCKAVHNKSFRQLSKDYRYPDTTEKLRKYTPADIRYDLQHGYLRFKTISKPSMADNRAVAQFVQEQMEWYDSIYMAAGSDL